MRLWLNRSLTGLASLELGVDGLGELGVENSSTSVVSGSDCEEVYVDSISAILTSWSSELGFCMEKSVASMFSVKLLWCGAFIHSVPICVASCGGVRGSARGAKLRSAGRARIKGRCASRMAVPLPVALVNQELVVKENAVEEVLPNDVEEQAMDTVSKGWSKDQWISGVLERAIGIVARSAEKSEQDFRLAPWSDVRYSVSNDKELGVFYENTRDLQTRHLGKYFTLKNVDLKPTNGATIHVQGTQRPDSVSLLRLTANGTENKVCICFEGDAHNLDAKKASGMYSYEKMFQDAAFCHDVNAGVPAIFITSALWKHDKGTFPTFSDWSEQFLKEHVVLVEQLLQYIADKSTSSLHRELQRIDPDMANTREFDFFCWINAQGDGDDAGSYEVEFDVSECFDLMRSDSRYHEKEFDSVLSWREKFYAVQGDWVQNRINGNANGQGTGLEATRFEAKIIRRNVHGIPVVIFAVPRISMNDVRALIADKTHVCSGMWYPMHVHAYVDGLKKKQIENFLTPNTLNLTARFKTPFSALPYTDQTRVLTQTEFDNQYKTDMSGQVLFTLPWLWINIGFLCKLKSSLTYKVGKASTIAAYNAFTRKHATNVNSRDNVKNEMEMFADGSTSLFAHLCRGRQEKSGIDDELASFLRNKCGWTNAASASSPAVFFAMLGVRNLITAHTLAKRNKGAKSKYSVELEKVKDSFPLAAQVEIDYALECLCRHYYFAQDKSAVQDDVVPRAEFERMQRKLRKEVEAARAQSESDQDAQASEDEADANVVQNADNNVKVEEDEKEETDTSQVDNGGYKAVAGERVRGKPNSDEITLDFLRDKQLVVKYPTKGPGNEKRWFRGKVTRRVSNRYFINFDDGDTFDEYLKDTNYGTTKKWLIIEKVQ